MRPTKFVGMNCTFAKDQPQYEQLPAHRCNDRYGTVISCWKLSVKERLCLLITGRVWVSLATFGKALQPQRLEVDVPTQLRELIPQTKGLVL